MTFYYTAFASRTHAFLLERRLRDEDILCELTYMPRILLKDLCNMGVKFGESEFRRAVDVIRRAGLPGCRLYKEIVHPGDSEYIEIELSKAGR